tara:strand:+ start:975 stop:1220 length:246 start_codon:yes stop_codon:yes gene_type:complete
MYEAVFDSAVLIPFYSGLVFYIYYDTHLHGKSRVLIPFYSGLVFYQAVAEEPMTRERLNPFLFRVGFLQPLVSRYVIVDKS